MSTIQSITSFFRRADFRFWRASNDPLFWGRLDEHLVQSRKPVIVFEYPKILQTADTVEEATTFLVKAKVEGKAFQAAVYELDTKVWRAVDTTQLESSLPIVQQEAEDTPQVAA
jgi:hypothetical protein